MPGTGSTDRRQVPREGGVCVELEISRFHATGPHRVHTARVACAQPVV